MMSILAHLCRFCVLIRLAVWPQPNVFAFGITYVVLTDCVVWPNAAIKDIFPRHTCSCRHNWAQLYIRPASTAIFDNRLFESRMNVRVVGGLYADWLHVGERCARTWINTYGVRCERDDPPIGYFRCTSASYGRCWFWFVIRNHNLSYLIHIVLHMYGGIR